MPDFSAAAITIRTIFNSEFADEFSVAYDNAPFTIPDAGLWIRCNIQPLENSQIEMADAGNRRFRMLGLLTATIFQTLELGDSSILDLADRIVVKFRTTTYSDVVFRTPSIDVLGRTDDQKYYGVSVNCPFYIEERG